MIQAIPFFFFLLVKKKNSRIVKDHVKEGENVPLLRERDIDRDKPDMKPAVVLEIQSRH